MWDGVRKKAAINNEAGICTVKNQQIALELQ
jgi:hypothetical protein